MNRIHRLMIFLVCVIILSLVWKREAFSTASPSAKSITCKDIITKQLNIQNQQQFNDMFKFDISSRIVSKRPVCNPSKVVVPLETVAALKANLKCTPNMENINQGVTNCILPLANFVNDFGESYISLKVNNATDFLDATLKFGGNDTMVLKTNIPNVYGTNVQTILSKKGVSYSDNYENWGMILSIDQNQIEDLIKKLTTLYVFKNKQYFTELQNLTNQCNSLESQKENLMAKKTSLENKKDKEIEARNDLRKKLNTAQQQLQAQQKETNEYRTKLNNIQQSLKNVKDDAEEMRERLEKAAGLRVKAYSGYFYNGSVSSAVDFIRKTRPVKSYVVQNFYHVNGENVYYNIQGSKTMVSLMATGYFRPDVTGTWTFSVSTDDRCMLWFGSGAIDQWTGSVQPTINLKIGTTTFTRYVQAGKLYGIRILHGNAEGPGKLTLYYKSPDAPNTWKWNGKGKNLPIFYQANFD